MTNPRVHDLVFRKLACAAMQVEEILNEESAAIFACIQKDTTPALDVCQEAVAILRDMARAYHQKHLAEGQMALPFGEEQP